MPIRMTSPEVHDYNDSIREEGIEELSCDSYFTVGLSQTVVARKSTVTAILFTADMSHMV